MENIEEDWEEEIIMVDLSGLIDCDWASCIGKTCKLVGMESDRPVLQLGRHIFCGEYKDSVGTRVLFEKIPGDGGTFSLKHSLNTFKILDMQKIFLTERKENDENGDNKNGDENLESNVDLTHSVNDSKVETPEPSTTRQFQASPSTT